jgi:hypothetical protein
MTQNQFEIPIPVEIQYTQTDLTMQLDSYLTKTISSPTDHPVFEMPTKEPIIVDLPKVRSSQKEIKSRCNEIYESFRNKYEEYPQSFIRFCTATLKKTGKPTAYQSMCGYEVVWESIEEGCYGVSEFRINSIDECQNFFSSIGYWNGD